MANVQWAPLGKHLVGLGLKPGQTVTLAIDELRRILGVTTLPNVVDRITFWDPLMGRSGGGLQRVLHEARMIPVAFGWTGDHTQRPQLSGVILQKWGNGVA
jgi:hypothetical protein